MGLNFNIPLPGPFSYSTRIGGGKPGPGLAHQYIDWYDTREQRAADRQAIRDEQDALQRKVDTLPAVKLWRVHTCHWLLVFIASCAALTLVGPVGVAVPAALVPAVWWSHRQRRARRDQYAELLAAEMCT